MGPPNVTVVRIVMSVKSCVRKREREDTKKQTEKIFRQLITRASSLFFQFTRTVREAAAFSLSLFS